MVKLHIDYVIVPRTSDGTYDIFEKDLRTKRLKFNSNHDTKGEAISEKNSLKGKPSQADSIKMMRDLKMTLTS